MFLLIQNSVSAQNFPHLLLVNTWNKGGGGHVVISNMRILSVNGIAFTVCCSKTNYTCYFCIPKYLEWIVKVTSWSTSWRSINMFNYNWRIIQSEYHNKINNNVLKMYKILSYDSQMLSKIFSIRNSFGIFVSLQQFLISSWY